MSKTDILMAMAAQSRRDQMDQIESEQRHRQYEAEKAGTMTPWGGAAMGASLGSFGGPVGSAIGAGIGGLGGLLVGGFQKKSLADEYGEDFNIADVFAPKSSDIPAIANAATAALMKRRLDKGGSIPGMDAAVGSPTRGLSASAPVGSAVTGDPFGVQSPVPRQYLDYRGGMGGTLT